LEKQTILLSLAQALSLVNIYFFSS